MYVWKLINGSVEWLGVPSFLRNYGLPRADNILCPSPRWEVRGIYEIWALESQPGSRYGGADVPWRGAASKCLAYLPKIPVNTPTTVRHFYDRSPSGAPSGVRPKSLGLPAHRS